MKITTEQETSGFVTEPENETPTGNGGKLKVLCIILILLIAFIGIRTVTGVRSAKENLASQKKEISELKSELAVLKGETKEEDPIAMPTPEESHAAKDSELAGEFLDQLLTWKNAEEYQNVRNWLMNDHGVSADDPLLTEFMPELTEEQIGNANMKCGDITTYRLSEADGVRNYFALCRVMNKTDNNTGNGKVAVFYSISKDGISGISAYSLEG